MLKFIKKGWGSPEYQGWYCTIAKHAGEGLVTAIAQGIGTQGACLDCAIREGIAIETIRTPRPNKKLMAYVNHYEWGAMCPDDDCVEFIDFVSSWIESLAYSNPRG